MNREQFKEIINKLKLISEYSSEYYKFGIDLYGGKFPILDSVYSVISLLFEAIYSEEGYDWISWFCYENDFGLNGLEATDDDRPICQTVDELYDYIEQFKYGTN